MVVASFKPDTEMSEVLAVVAEEQAQVAALTNDGRLGAIYVSMPRKTVFIEVFADSAAEAESTVQLLPMSVWWTLDVFPTPAVPPAPAGQ